MFPKIGLTIENIDYDMKRNEIFSHIYLSNC